MTDFHQTILRDFTPEEFTPVMYRILGLDEAPWEQVNEAGMNPDTYVGGQARDTVAAVQGRVPVYTGTGVDAPRTSTAQAVCTPDIVYRSVKASYREGAKGIVYSPNYAEMNHTNLEGGAQALRELGVAVGIVESEQRC